ncbi:MAG: hypothetical protein C0501_31610 [Isosphaera sp.]|nr:hypothetical protein [Isosphaera sp.]
MTMKIDIDLADIVASKYTQGFHAPADIDVTTLLELADDDWHHELDLRAVLAGQHAIALIWDADMLRSRHPHLTAEQAWEALRECERNYTAEAGLTWDDVSEVVNDRFPDAAEARQRLLDRLQSLRRQVEALPDDPRADPAGYGEVVARLDDVEDVIRRTGGVA